jgi:hypothetical protein
MHFAEIFRDQAKCFSHVTWQDLARRVCERLPYTWTEIGNMRSHNMDHQQCGKNSKKLIKSHPACLSEYCVLPTFMSGPADEFTEG